MSTVIVITGPSGVGKGTLIARLLSAIPDCELSVSATTRAPRAGEQNGINYWFLTNEEFKRHIAEGAFVEYATYSGASYGTLRTEIDHRFQRGKIVILEIEVQGARQLRATLPDAVQIFISPPSFSALEKRLKQRGTESQDQIQQRLRVAEQELAAKSEFPYVLTNDNLDRATRELIELVQAKIVM